MNACAEVFEEHGGHHFSGGFSVHEDHIFSFGERLNDALRELGESAAINEEVLIDEILSLNEVTHALVKDLSLLAPYGTGNRKPLFAFKDVTPRKVEQFGKAEEHLKMIFETDAGTLEAIAFFTKAEDFQKNPENNQTFTLVAHVEQSYFMGRQQIRLRVVDVL
jgi:single-stranded-DNA-specific exonuclease